MDLLPGELFFVAAIFDRNTVDRVRITTTLDPNNLFRQWRHAGKVFLPVVVTRVDEDALPAFSRFGFQPPTTLTLVRAAEVLRNLPVDTDVLRDVNAHLKTIPTKKRRELQQEWAGAVAGTVGVAR